MSGQVPDMWISNFKKYGLLFAAFFKTSFVADLEYRINFAVRFLSDIFWYIGQLLTFEVIFLHVPQIAGWSAPQMRVFLAILFITDALYMMLWHDGLTSMTDAIRKGELDFLLVRPVNSQFMITSQKIATAYLGNFTFAFIWFFWTCSQIPDLNWLNMFWLIIMIPAAMSVIYSIRFFLSASTVLFTKADSLQFIWYTIFRLGHRPDRIYQGAMRYFVLFLLPVGMIASAPAQVILETPNPWMILWALVFTPLSMFLTHQYWNFCLSKYTSASS